MVIKIHEPTDIPFSKKLKENLLDRISSETELVIEDIEICSADLVCPGGEVCDNYYHGCNRCRRGKMDMFQRRSHVTTQ